MEEGMAFMIYKFYTWYGYILGYIVCCKRSSVSTSVLNFQKHQTINITSYCRDSFYHVYIKYLADLRLNKLSWIENKIKWCVMNIKYFYLYEC